MATFLLHTLRSRRISLHFHVVDPENPVGALADFSASACCHADSNYEED
jgi:hypothetical protein